MSSETGYSDKTVDFKAINSYKKNVNILNKLGYENTDEFRQLSNYIKQFKLGKDERHIKANVTCPTGRYNISDGEHASEFFNALDKCNQKGIALHFREMQSTDFENDVGSGIMIDFDIYQESSKNPLENKNTHDLCKSILRCLENMLERDEEVPLITYVAVIVKPKLIFNKDKGLWKNGIHILIPHIKLSREQKRLFLNRVLCGKTCQEEFSNLFGVSLASALDLMCASVPVYFLHNCKEDSVEPYVLKELYKFTCKKQEYSGLDYDLKVISVPPSINRELSLSFKGIHHSKIFYKFKEQFAKTLKIASNRELKFNKEMDASSEVFNHFNSYVDENLEYYKTLVMEVLDIKRAEDRKMWRDVVFAIANINKGFKDAFKEIARMFSMRCQEKYDTEAFETLWSQAIDSKNNRALTFNSIVYWCKEDNPRKFDTILDKDITTIIELDTFSRANQVLTGSLFQYHFAYYIFHLFKQKFAYDIDGKNGKWYEFVLDSDEHRTGEIYKWRHEIKPDNLIIYISNRLPEIVSKVLEKAETRAKTVEDEEIVKYITNRAEKLRKSGENLYKTEFKNGIIKEAESLFRRRGFIQSLDEAENIMGVANGVLVFDNGVKFVSGYHEYLVSMYSEVSYYPFNIKSEETKLFLKVVMGMFPDDEMDMFHYLMYYFATCLDNRAKDSMFLILQGSGSNGKSSLLELAKTVLGQYGAKVSMSILTEQRNNSSSANEQMMAYKRSRLAFYSETNKQEEINCAVVKEFTSQESVTTRAIFQSQTTFRPKCNHVITTNYYPIIKTTDYGIWRRMKLYRHKIQFKPKSKLDVNNKYEKLADENIAKEFSYNKGIREAFLSLLVEYYKDLYENHGGKLSNIRCDSLERDSLEYRNSMDTLNRFICQNVIVSKGSKVNINEMVDAYATFLVEEYGKNTQIYKNELKQLVENSELRAFYKIASGGKTEFVGIRLHDSSDSDEMLVDGEYFLKMKKTNEQEEDTSHKNYSDPLGLDEWYKANC